MQSENLKGVTSGTGPGYTMVIKLSCRMSCRPSVTCLHLCVVGSHAWTPRVGGAMRVGPEASHVYSRQSVSQSVGPALGGSPWVVPGTEPSRLSCDQHSFIGGSRGAPVEAER